MSKQELIKNLKKIKNLDLVREQPLSDYTSFEVGGPADIFLIPTTIPAAQQAFKIINEAELPVLILGAGSNLVISDQGFAGAVIYTEQLDQIKIIDTTIIAQTGVSLAELSDTALEHNLTGFEFASGIPGSLGGGLYMNAGAYGGELKDVISEITVINSQGQQQVLDKSKINLGYRQSILQEKSYLAVEVELELERGSKSEIKAKIEDLTDKRWTKQPMEMPSAGSMFKRPANHYASALIDQAGLKGTRVGDAQVSTKHAGFVVNLGSATAQDIKELVELVQEKIYKEYEVELETEPRFIGEFK
ncbi:MAG: UDP-N-acetylmuramate dehydrogenase [Bacillota bacterium]